MISTSYDILDLDDSAIFTSIHEGNNYHLPKAKLMGKEMHQLYFVRGYERIS
jgi:hypothetical protein